MIKRLTLLILLVIAGYAKPAFADACLDAPPPRLRMDAEAVVTAGRLNMRALPVLDAGVSAQLFSGNHVTVIAGPSCNGLYTWWRVESANGSRGWVAEGTWEAYYVVPVEDADAPPTPFEAACVLDFDPLYCL